MNDQTREVMKYILDTYGVEAEYPWMKTPNNAVFRNMRTKKWFAALLGELPKRYLGLHDDGIIDVLNLKCDPIMTFSLIDNKCVFRAYHMNKKHWISVMMDGSMPMDELVFLIDMSYKIVDSVGKTQRKVPID